MHLHQFHVLNLCKMEITEGLPLEEKNEKNENSTILSEAIGKLDKEIFFSASMAKNKTIAVHKKRLEVEMLPIYEQINAAISKGEYQICVRLTSDQKEFLYNKNFRMSIISSETSNNKTIYKCNLYWS